MQPAFLSQVLKCPHKNVSVLQLCQQYEHHLLKKRARVRQTGGEFKRKELWCLSGRWNRCFFPQPEKQQHWGCSRLLAVLVWSTERLNNEALAAVQAVGQVLLVTWLEVFRVQRWDGWRSCHTKRKGKVLALELTFTNVPVASC